MKTKELSGQQKRVHDLLAKGLSVGQIASRLHTNKGVVNAQITRMRNKGVTVPPAGVDVGKKAEEVLSEQVLTAFEQAGKIAPNVTIDKSTLPNLEHRLRAQPGAEHYLALGIHPFLQFDLVIKFVKLFGGRKAAHQAIEDVFGALREFIGIKTDEGCER